MEVLLLSSAFIFDMLLGDPKSYWHPVVLMGKLIAWLENKLLQETFTTITKKIAGGVLVSLVLVFTYGLVWLIIFFIDQVHSWLAFTFQALLLSFTISPRSLKEAGQEIQHYLEAGDIINARHKVGWIVGRDTDDLDSSEVTRATIETVAENIVDGIISPLFYAAVGGVPLAYLYRAVNTMDSMIGYKNERYLAFGMIAARVDDVFNYVPARVTGILIIIAAWILRLDARGALESIMRDAGKHPSPNSGFAEAAVAGALGIRLGGVNYYGGVKSIRAFMGKIFQPLVPIHIKQTSDLMYLVAALFILLIALIDKLNVDFF